MTEVQSHSVPDDPVKPRPEVNDHAAGLMISKPDSTTAQSEQQRTPDEGLEGAADMDESRALSEVPYNKEGEWDIGTRSETA